MKRAVERASVPAAFGSKGFHPVRRTGKMPVPPRTFQNSCHTNEHFLTDTTKDDKWLVLVGRPSLAASRWRARRPAPPSYFHIKEQSKKYHLSF
jgi:hypothetical protein